MAGYDRARELIERNRDAVRLIAEALLEQESLEADEITALLARRRAPRVARHPVQRSVPSS